MLEKGTFFRSNNSDWVIYNEFDNKGTAQNFLRLVTPIPLELLLLARPDYWANVDNKPAGHIQDALVQKIIQLTECAESEIFVDIQPPPNPQQQQQQQQQ